MAVEFMKDGPEGDEIASRLESVEVGTDDDGDPITSCIILPIEGYVAPDASKARPLSNKLKIALEVLHRGINDSGELLPSAFGLPHPITGFTVDQWRC